MMLEKKQYLHTVRYGDGTKESWTAEYWGIKYAHGEGFKEIRKENEKATNPPIVFLTYDAHRIEYHFREDGYYPIPKQLLPHDAYSGIEHITLIGIRHIPSRRF